MPIGYCCEHPEKGSARKKVEVSPETNSCWPSVGEVESKAGIGMHDMAGQSSSARRFSPDQIRRILTAANPAREDWTACNGRHQVLTCSRPRMQARSERAIFPNTYGGIDRALWSQTGHRQRHAERALTRSIPWWPVVVHLSSPRNNQPMIASGSSMMGSKTSP